ncbi:MAG: hypothetical protein K2M91_02705, partial [Lachnospiraceae bacterium]|nr:hypothetical protein [Lachnospiraceae bacterium]
MVIGRLRRTLKRGMSIAMAAALMVTSVPQLSVLSMAQEEKNIVQEEGTDENISQEADQGETEEGKSQSGGSTENASTEEDREDSEETQKISAEQSEEEDGSEDAGETEADTDAAEDDEKELEEDKTEEESKTKEEEEKKVSNSDKVRAEEDEIEGKLIYENNFDSETENTSLADGIVVKLNDGNMAVEYDVDLSQSEEKWTDIFQAGFDLSPSYDEAITQKMTMSFDVYFKKEGNDNTDGSEAGEDGSNSQSNDDGTEKIGKMAAKAALKVGDASQWTEGDNGLLDLTDADLVDAEIDGYSKFHIVLDMSSKTGWKVEDITSIRTVVPCLAGNGSTFKGKIYLDNVVLKDTSTTSGEQKPGPDNYEVLYNGTSATLKGPSAGAAHSFYTKHVGGNFDNATLDKGSYFTLEYTSTINADTDEKSKLTIALSSVSDTDSESDKRWIAVEPTRTEKLENGNYLSTYTIEDCIEAFGSNLNRLDQVEVFTSWETAEDAEFVLKEMRYYPGNGTLVDANGETKWTNKSTTGIGFIGDSICQNAMLDYKNWNTILDRADCKDTNWGIGGQDTTQISRRIDDMLDSSDYEKIVVLCGINDLGHGITKDRFIENYTTIIDKIHTAQAETEIFAISILPTTSVFYADQQQDIKDRNAALKELAEKYEYVTFVDCHSRFYDESTGYC